MTDRRGGGTSLRDIVDEEAGVGAIEVGIRGSILTGGGLEHRHQELTIRGDIDRFHALVVAAAARLDARGDRGGFSGEARVSRIGELRDKGLDGGNDALHLAGLAHVIDRSAVFIGDIEAAVGTDREAFAIDRELSDAADTGGRDVGEAAEGRAARVERRGRVAVKVGNLSGTLEGQSQLRLADRVGRVVGREGQVELLNTRGVVDEASHIITAVRQSVERAGIGAVGVLAPGIRVDLEGREGAERVAETVDCTRGERTHTDETLIEIRSAVERHRLHRADRSGVKVRRRVGDRTGRQRDRGGGGEKQGAGEGTHVGVRLIWSRARVTTSVAM